MSMIINPYRFASAGPVADWFEVVLWTGNGSGGATVPTSLDLSNGGMVWVKRRDAAGNPTLYFKNTSGATVLAFNTSNTTAATTPTATLDNGSFTVPDNISAATYVAWIFKKKVGSFDIATWTGNATAGHLVAHSLGVAPGFTFAVQATGTKLNYAQHASLPATQDIRLDSNAAAATSNQRFFDTYVSATQITLGASTLINGSGVTGFAFLFGGADISAGSYAIGGVSAPADITPGWTPRFVLLRQSNATASWGMFDTTRTPGFTGNDAQLIANTTAAETTSPAFVAIPGGVQVSAGTAYTGVSSTNIYLLIK